jgi:hypothetical protein
MKTIALLAVLFAGSAFGGYLSGDDPDYWTKSVQRNYPEPASQSRIFASTPSNEEACRPVKPTQVDYTIVTLPDGQTASALTFKD